MDSAASSPAHRRAPGIVLATVVLALIPVMVPLAIVRAQQPAPRAPAAPPPARTAAERVLIIIAPGDPAWPDPPPSYDGEMGPTPIAYNTDILARQVGDELRRRGITVAVAPAERIEFAHELLGHELVVLAWPARRFLLGAGLQHLIDQAWEPLVRDRPQDATKQLWSGLVIAARQDWADQSLEAVASTLAAGGAGLATRRVLLTSLTGAEVSSAVESWSDELAALIDRRRPGTAAP